MILGLPAFNIHETIRAVHGDSVTDKQTEEVTLRFNLLAICRDRVSQGRRLFWEDMDPGLELPFLVTPGRARGIDLALVMLVDHQQPICNVTERCAYSEGNKGATQNQFAWGPNPVQFSKVPTFMPLYLTGRQI